MKTVSSLNFKEGYLRRISVLLFILFCCQLASVPSSFGQKTFDPPALYSTWTDDPTSSITIIWHGLSGDNRNIPFFEFHLRNSSGDWVRLSPISKEFPFSSRMMHQVDLKDLEPNTEYSFRFEEGAPDSLTFYFRTMPDEVTRPINFAAGGDANAGDEFEKTNKEAMKFDLDFVMFGGDLVYANGRPSQVDKVFKWLEIAKRTFIAADGRLVPIVAAIGDHEFRRSRYNKEWGINSLEEINELEDKTQSAPYYYAMFPFPGYPAWGVLDFGNYMSVVLLHAGAFPPIEGEQTEWLQEILKDRQNAPHVFPIYHHGIYPAVRTSYEDQKKYWAPLFEEYGVKIAFENHDHVYKRTFPMREGKIVDKSDGVVYLGDGSWGNLRTKVHAGRRYLAKTLSLRSFIIGSIYPGDKEFQFRMYDNNGNRIDSFPE